jgi:hypothetical protein
MFLRERSNPGATRMASDGTSRPAARRRSTTRCNFHVLCAITALVSNVSAPEIRIFSSRRRPRSEWIGPVWMTRSN